MAEQRVWDIHAHFVPPTFVADMRRNAALEGIKTETVDGREWLVHREGVRTSLEAGLYDIEARLADMDSKGIDVAVIALQPTLYSYGVSEDEAVDFARMVNDEIAQATSQSGGRLLGLAQLPLQSPDASAQEARRASELGLAGCQVGPVVGNLTLDDPQFFEVLRVLQDARMPVTFHPYMIGGSDRTGLDKYYLVNLVGHPYQTCLGATRLVMSGALDRLPDLDVVLLHGGGFFPYQLGRLDHGYRVRPESKECASLPSSYLRRFTFDTLTHSAASLQFLTGLAGADRVAYGTDYPYDMGGGTLAEQTSGVELADDDRDLVGGGNAERLYVGDAAP